MDCEKKIDIDGVVVRVLCDFMEVKVMEKGWCMFIYGYIKKLVGVDDWLIFALSDYD